MKKLTPSLLTAGLCASLMLSNPLTVNGEQSTQSFDSTIGVGTILSAQLSDEDQKELVDLAVRMLYENMHRNYSLDNARERMHIGDEPQEEQTEESDTEYNNRWGVENLTEREKELLADIVWLEAGNQGLTGQELIVVTILNRVVSEGFDDEVVGVLSADGQFSTWPRVSEAKPTDETYEAIEKVLSGEADSNVIDAQYKYFNNKPSFGNDYVKVGGHYFYK